MLVAARVDYHRYRVLALPLLAVATALLAAVLIPGVGTTVNGATRWLRAGTGRHPAAEFAKLALILYLAFWLGARRDRIEQSGTAIGFVLVTGIIGALVFAEPDLGTAIVIGAIALAMYFAAGARLWMFGALAMLSGVLALAGALGHPERIERLTTFIDPWKDPTGAGYQAIQALYGLALGGLFGEGLGAGREKFGSCRSRTPTRSSRSLATSSGSSGRSRDHAVPRLRVPRRAHRAACARCDGRAHRDRQSRRGWCSRRG
jgi:cell division protein FtsW